MKHKSRTVTMILCVILLIAFFLAALALCQYINYRHLEQEIPEVWYPTLYVYKTNDGYKVYLNSGNRPTGSFTLAASGTILRTWNTEPADIDHAASLLGRSLTAVIAEYGEPHADIGSGFSIPAYITNDSRLIVLRETENIISEISVRDLRTDVVLDTFLIS